MNQFRLLGQNEIVMSFLDNLESTLKNLESQEERDPNANARRESERARTLAAAPWAEKLKQSPYTHELMNAAAAAGHRIRTKIYMAWLGTTFRLEARGRKLELRPTADGIIAVFLEENEEIRSEPVNLDDNPQSLLTEWIAQLPSPAPVAPDPDDEG
jgi:hypothetical protein